MFQNDPKKSHQLPSDLFFHHPKNSGHQNNPCFKGHLFFPPRKVTGKKNLAKTNWTSNSSPGVVRWSRSNLAEPPAVGWKALRLSLVSLYRRATWVEITHKNLRVPNWMVLFGVPKRVFLNTTNKLNNLLVDIFSWFQTWFLIFFWCEVSWILSKGYAHRHYRCLL